jgi:hypothetical protein
MVEVVQPALSGVDLSPEQATIGAMAALAGEAREVKASRSIHDLWPF